MAGHLEALRERVASFLGNRIYSPDEQRAILELDSLENGSGDPEVREVARALRFYGPTRPERGPSPLDEEIAEARKRRDAMDEKVAEARRKRRVQRARDDQGVVVGLMSFDPAADRALYFAEEERRLENARLQDLLERRARWYALREARFHDPEGGPGLTIEELHKRLEQESGRG